MLKYFDIWEFDSPDAPGSGMHMKPTFLKMIDQARERANMPFVVSSGYRTPIHNEKVGGKTNSAHLTGYAADIKYTSIREAVKIVKAARKAGFQRIGLGNSFIHMDNDSSKKSPAMWVYPDTPKALIERVMNLEKINPFSYMLLALGFGTVIYLTTNKNN